MPIERAVPAMVRIAASTSVVFRSCIFMRGDLLELLLRDLADLVLVRLLRARARLLRRRQPRRLLEQDGAGGVFMMKVNERSE